MIPQDDPMTQSRPSFARIEQAPAFLPHCNDSRIVAMGLAPMQGSWVDTTSSDVWRAHKTSVRNQLGRRVYAVLDEGVAAAGEFAGLIFDPCGRKIYRANVRSIRCRGVVARFPRGGRRFSSDAVR